MIRFEIRDLTSFPDTVPVPQIRLRSYRSTDLRSQILYYLIVRSAGFAWMVNMCDLYGSVARTVFEGIQMVVPGKYLLIVTRTSSWRCEVISAHKRRSYIPSRVFVCYEASLVSRRTRRDHEREYSQHSTDTPQSS